MSKISAVIIEDEKASRETLRNYLEKYCKDINLLAEAENIIEGLNIIKKHKPQLVFLDIEMPYGNAFDLLEQIEEIDFEIVFVTAYSNYAIRALNISAAYYLLKPIDIEELIQAVEKIKAVYVKNSAFNHTKVLVENIKIENKQLQKVVLPVIDGFEVVRVNEIIRCEADDNYTRFFLTEGKQQLICRTLKYYEDILKEYDFIRIHKSHLVNFQYIRQYRKGKGGQIVMNDGSVVDVSANRKQELIEKFK
jgi:two-component system LytT family response regulator